MALLNSRYFVQQQFHFYNFFKNTSRCLATVEPCNENNDKSCDYDVVIVGGGIVGVATARELKIKNPGLNVAIVEKECQLAAHQSGHNSGVIHAGIYYVPGSLKAKLCGKGLRLLYDYCDRNGVPYKKVGKIIVATTKREVQGLKTLEERGRKNDVPDLQVLNGLKEIQKIEPNCKGLKALLSPHTGIIDFACVTEFFAKDFKNTGGKIYLNFEVDKFEKSSECDFPVQLRSTNKEYVKAKYVLTCGGLYSDVLASKSKCSKDPQIIPFRGEYLVLDPSKSHLVNGNIYPVPDPRFPFLGVHFTPRMDGSVLLGPNAVLAFRREGYSWTDINISELKETILYSGFRKMAFKYAIPGSKEIIKSLIPSLIVKDLQKFIPQLSSKDVKKGMTGVRAQAMAADGSLVDDFVFSRGEGDVGERILHCRNAPSPGCTSSMAIAEMLVEKINQEFDLK